MAQQYMPSYSGTEPFPLTKKPRGEVVARRALRLRVWLARALFTVLFASVLALLVYEIRSVYRTGWRATFHTLITR